MSVAFLFPGQGSQVEGMLHALPDHPAVERTFDEISETLHADIQDFDSAEALQSTVSVQLALLASGVAVARALIEEGVFPDAVAGLSVGAFAAAVLSGVVNFPDAVRLVQQRAEMMSTLYPKGYGLAAIVGLTETQVSNLVDQAHSEATPVYVGNLTAPRQIVIAGSDAGMANVMEAARKSGARKAERLPVSVPSHCPLLEPVAVALRKSLRTITLNAPQCVYIGNVKARTLRTSDAVADDLASNIAHGVRWHDATGVMAELGCDLFLEMPPGHVLSSLGHEAFQNLTFLAIGESSLRHVVKVVPRQNSIRVQNGDDVLI